MKKWFIVAVILLCGSGLARGDVIVKIDKKRVNSIDDYEDILRSYADQEKVDLTVYRKGHPLKFNATIKTFPLEKAMAISEGRYGLRLSGKRYAKQNGLPIDKVRPNSPASRIGLRKGDIVHQVNEIKITSLNDYLKAMAKYRLRHSIGMVVQRGRYAYSITLAP